MSSPFPLAPIIEAILERPFPRRYIKPLLTPYYLVVAGALGAATAGLIALVVVLLIIATNFNVLGAIE